jgi:hypothetical protein
MNKEQQELLDEVYENYRQKIISEDLWMLVAIGWPSTQEEFINKCKTDSEFSERWGLMIEERELSSDERYNLLSESEKKNFIITMRPMMSPDDKYDEVHYTIDNYYEHIPKRAIAITYNDKTIESYENNS